jgi:hypothetical protein
MWDNPLEHHTHLTVDGTDGTSVLVELLNGNSHDLIGKIELELPLGHKTQARPLWYDLLPQGQLECTAYQDMVKNTPVSSTRGSPDGGTAEGQEEEGGEGLMGTWGSSFTMESILSVSVGESSAAAADRADDGAGASLSGADAGEGEDEDEDDMLSMMRRVSKGFGFDTLADGKNIGGDAMDVCTLHVVVHSAEGLQDTVGMFGTHRPFVKATVRGYSGVGRLQRERRRRSVLSGVEEEDVQDGQVGVEQVDLTAQTEAILVEDEGGMEAASPVWHEKRHLAHIQLTYDDVLQSGGEGPNGGGAGTGGDGGLLLEVWNENAMIDDLIGSCELALPFDSKER